jgi:DNA-binding response OmpR family regulator
MMTETHTLLLVEEDEITRTFLADNLTADGYEVLLGADAEDALRLAAQEYPDVAVIDVNGASGRAFVRAVRAGAGGDDRLAIVLLSAEVDELERVRAFDCGADDLVVKPFSYVELRARIAALLRRAQMRERVRRPLRVGALSVNLTSREVRVHGESIVLSQKEFALLRTLASDPTRVFAKDELLRTIWGYRAKGSTRTLDSHACRLRHKLAVNDDRFVVNVWGVGYRLVDASVGEPAGERDAAAA